MITTDYDKLIPKRVLFSIREINDMGLIKSAMLKKMIAHRMIEVVKVSTKNFISRSVLIAYLETNTIPAIEE
jgi:hypothetical protein